VQRFQFAVPQHQAKIEGDAGIALEVELNLLTEENSD